MIVLRFANVSRFVYHESINHNERNTMRGYVEFLESRGGNATPEDWQDSFLEAADEARDAQRNK